MSSSSQPAEADTVSAAYPDDAILPFTGPSLPLQASRPDATAQPIRAAQGSSISQKATTACVAAQDSAGVYSAAAKDGSTAESIAEAKGFGPGFLAKLYTPDVSSSSPPAEAGTVLPMPQDECVHPSIAPSPSLQAGRPVMTAQPTLGSSSAQTAINAGVAVQDGAGVVQDGRAAVRSYSAAVQGGSAPVEDGYAAESMAEGAGVQDPPQPTASVHALADASAPEAQLMKPPTPLRRAVYHTPLPPNTSDAMSAERQSHQASVPRVSLAHDTALRRENTRGAGMRGAYVTFMLPPSPPTTTDTTSSSRQIAATEQPSACGIQQRESRMDDDACDVMHQAAELQYGSARDDEHVGASQQDNESLQATDVQQPRKKRRSNNRKRRRKASRQAAIADSEH